MIFLHGALALPLFQSVSVWQGWWDELHYGRGQESAWPRPCAEGMNALAANFLCEVEAGRVGVTFLRLGPGILTIRSLGRFVETISFRL